MASRTTHKTVVVIVSSLRVIRTVFGGGGGALHLYTLVVIVKVDPLGLVEMRMQVDTFSVAPFDDLDTLRRFGKHVPAKKESFVPGSYVSVILPRGVKKVPTRVRTGDLMRVKHA